MSSLSSLSQAGTDDFLLPAEEDFFFLVCEWESSSISESLSSRISSILSSIINLVLHSSTHYTTYHICIQLIWHDWFYIISDIDELSSLRWCAQPFQATKDATQSKHNISINFIRGRCWITDAIKKHIQYYSCCQSLRQNRLYIDKTVLRAGVVDDADPQLRPIQTKKHTLSIIPKFY